MNWRGSVMRHFTSQSITRLFFSAVKMGRVSGLSSVCMRLSRKTTFWNGGGSLNFRPGFGDDLLDLAQRVDDADLPLVDDEQGEAASIRASSAERR
jgi:hypothetical protein